MKPIFSTLFQEWGAKKLVHVVLNFNIGIFVFAPLNVLAQEYWVRVPVNCCNINTEIKVPVTPPWYKHLAKPGEVVGFTLPVDCMALLKGNSLRLPVHSGVYGIFYIDVDLSVLRLKLLTSKDCALCNEIAPYCCDKLREELKRKLGRLRAIRAEADTTDKASYEALQSRDKVRDKIYGPQGSARDFFESLLVEAACAKLVGDYLKKNREKHNGRERIPPSFKDFVIEFGTCSAFFINLYITFEIFSKDVFNWFEQNKLVNDLEKKQRTIAADLNNTVDRIIAIRNYCPELNHLLPPGFIPQKGMIQTPSTRFSLAAMNFGYSTTEHLVSGIKLEAPHVWSQSKSTSGSIESTQLDWDNLQTVLEYLDQFRPVLDRIKEWNTSKIKRSELEAFKQNLDLAIIFGYQVAAAFGSKEADPLLKENFTILVQMLNSEDAQVRKATATALGEIGADAEEAVPVLTTLQNSDINAEVREAATAALTQIAAQKQIQETNRLITAYLNALDLALASGNVINLSNFYATDFVDVCSAPHFLDTKLTVLNEL